MESKNAKATIGLKTARIVFPPSRKRLSFYFRILFIALISFVFSVSPALAQEPAGDDIAPPPLKQISKAERSQLDAETDVKKRAKLVLDLMDIRLKKAEELHARQAYTEMFLELGGFHGLVDNSLAFLKLSRDRR